MNSSIIFADDSSVLVLFCKRPLLGVGKQRVAAELGQAKALEVSQLLLSAALADLREWPGAKVIAPAAEEDVDWADELLADARSDVQVVPQGSGNLGTRINHVDATLRAAGAGRILYIGIDAPGLTASVLSTASHVLASCDAVLIPAADGGVTLLGSSLPWPALDSLPWETDQLGASLQACCAQADWQCLALDAGNDIDTWADLQQAQPTLATDPRPTRQALARWIGREQSPTEPGHKTEPTSATQTAHDAPPEQAATISLIVPVHQDLHALRGLLQQLTDMQASFAEMLVVDSADRPEGRQLCEHFGAQYVVAEPCRGAQLDAGARLASGHIVWFLHADCEPPRNALALIRAHIAAGPQGGYFRFRFLGARAWRKRILEAAINWRASIGIPYGDQGLFMTRDAYTRAGGFPAQPLFEEVALVRQLRAAGPFNSLAASLGVSPRRWERDGWLRRTVLNRLLALGHMLGMSPTTLARRYQRNTQGSLPA